MRMIFQTFMKASKDNLKDAAKELQEKTCSPMNTMLEKQPSWEETLQKRAHERSKMVTKDAPPTTPGIKELHNSTNVYNLCPIHCVKALKKIKSFPVSILFSPICLSLQTLCVPVPNLGDNQLQVLVKGLNFDWSVSLCVFSFSSPRRKKEAE